jgi:serine/threonine-protein kinase
MGAQGLQRTQTGNMLGTPAYISPEQARAEGVDHRTDIYALGAMAFEIFTGEYVFMATNAADMIAKHLFEAPRSVRALNPHVPPGLDALLTRMLAKDAHQRPTLAEVRNQLRAIRLLLGGMPTPPPGLQDPHTPPHGAHLTPMQMTPSSLPGAHPASTLQAASRRSRLPLIIGVLLAIGAIATAAIVVVGSRQPTAARPAVEAPAAETIEMKPSEPKPAAPPVEAKPTEPAPIATEPAPVPAPPASAPPPVETKAADTKAAETKHTKRDGSKRDGTKRDGTKRTTTKPATTTKPETVTPTTTTPKPGTGSATKPFDPDAPM